MRRVSADVVDPEFDVADVDSNSLLAQAGWAAPHSDPIADDEAEPTVALDPQQLAPWHVPAGLREQHEHAPDRSWAAALTALVEPLDAEPTSARTGNTNAEDISHTAPVHPQVRRERQEAAAAELRAHVARESETPVVPMTIPDNTPPAPSQPSAARTNLSRWLPPPDIRHWLWMAAGGCAVVAAQLSLQAMSPEAPVVPVQGTPVPTVETTLRITTHPADAAVFVDGKPTGKTTPVNLRGLMPGLHSVELQRAGYFDSSFPVSLEAGTVTQLPELELRPLTAANAPSTGAEASAEEAPAPSPRARPKPLSSAEEGEGVLQISSQPWSLVIIDDQVVGTTPQRAIRLPAGRHVVRLVNDDLQMSKRIKVQIREGKTLKTFVNL